MSKKKNTLKDLDEFLKQQAAVLVPPAPLAEAVQTARESVKHTAMASSPAVESPGFSKEELYDMVLAALESQKSLTSEDTMIINSILYVRNQPNWKEAVRTYWSNRK